MFDIFVTHDWRESEERAKALDLLDQAFGLDWRNFGTPWYDPALQISSSEGAAIIRGHMECQLPAAKIVVFLPGIYTGSSRGRIWVGYSLEIARRLSIPVIGVEFPNHPLSADIRALADSWIPARAADLRCEIESRLCA
jgi:hypothetical protein